jgi:hypothetical protein
MNGILGFKCINRLPTDENPYQGVNIEEAAIAEITW